MAKSGERKKLQLIKQDPFKVRKSRNEGGSASVSDTVTPPEEVALAVDAFRAAQEQAKHFEGEATVHKDVIVDYAQQEYAKRFIVGHKNSFKILGEQTMVTYISMDRSAGLTDEDLEQLADRWGRKAADELVVRDYGSIKFDAKVLEANYDRVVEALQTLPDDILGSLFKPMLMKAKPNVAESARKYAKTADDMRELLRQLKITNYIK